MAQPDGSQITSPLAAPPQDHGLLAEGAYAIDAMRDITPAVMKDNAPRVVAGLKMLGSGSMMFSKNPLFALTGAGFVTGNGIVMLFGGKKTEAEKAKLRAAQAAEDSSPHEGVIGHFAQNLRHPEEYPLEAGASVGTLSSAAWMGAGLMEPGGLSTGKLIAGGLSLVSDANVAFSKEDTQKGSALSDNNPYRQTTMAYALSELHKRPVLVSSLLNIGCDTASILGGAHEYFVLGKEPHALVAGSLLGLANAYQAIYVNKNDYNIEPPAQQTPSTILAADKSQLTVQPIQPDARLAAR